AERALENRLAALNLKIAAQPEARVPKEERARARRELDALQSTLYASHPDTAFQRGVAPAMTVAQIEETAAEARAVVLDYFATRSETYVFVIKPGAQPRVVALGIGQAVLNAKTSEFCRQLASHDLGYVQTAQELYRMLIGSAQRDLAQQAALIIIPDE